MYKIVRMFRDHPSKVIKCGVTLREAQKHCSNPQTSSSKTTDPKLIELTEKMGPWFDGYDEE